MHVSPEDGRQMAATLGCPVSSFPQPYLGLPLSPTKLPISAYAPLIRSFDRRLSGWQALLLSSGGCLVLCNVVLNNLASYYMCSYLLPQGMLESIDKRRRAFFWTGKDSCSGARCLISWDKVLLSKQEGGFSVKDLHWKNRQHSAQDLGDATSSPSFLDKIVHECLPLYRSITRATVVSGSSTAFWLDKWLPGKPLAERYPALFSHGTRPNASVAVDLRFIDSPSTPPFSTREAYRMLSPSHATDVSACTSWGLRLPSKVRIFSYLADIGRLSMRANLFYKGCAQSAVCAACPMQETGRHLFFDCSIATEGGVALEPPSRLMTSPSGTSRRRPRRQSMSGM
ncbi:hypothetical protein QYE76_033065 [Lolium multiflorum]|uniref:Reverse transcriptase zinc-binding domain-containing protein n=1 Tax=Lolium multiflorum TaxID=4521 RepID=A0AAD8VIY8_LOLMU|nr:hypothetical protein QYE76_033065 [Lolium multiflorum]